MHQSKTKMTNKRTDEEKEKEKLEEEEEGEEEKESEEEGLEDEEGSRDGSKVVGSWECTSQKTLYARWMLIKGEGRKKDEHIRELQKDLKRLVN